MEPTGGLTATVLSIISQNRHIVGLSAYQRYFPRIAWMVLPTFRVGVNFYLNGTLGPRKFRTLVQHIFSLLSVTSK
jgi:hypothetical protein